MVNLTTGLVQNSSYSEYGKMYCNTTSTCFTKFPLLLSGAFPSILVLDSIIEPSLKIRYRVNNSSINYSSDFMMGATDASISLQCELEAIVQAIHRSERLTCFHKSIKGKRCSNPLSVITHAKLALILNNVIQLLQNADNGIEVLVEEVSLLVMCVRDHQYEATGQFKEWSARIPTRKYSLNRGSNIEVSSSSV